MPDPEQAQPKVEIVRADGSPLDKPPPFSLTSLEENVRQVDANIRRLQEAIAREEERKVELQGYIQDHIEYNRRRKLEARRKKKQGQ